MLIDYKNVNITQQGSQVLRAVDFQADEGEFIYVIGRVGSGKTSLLKTFYAELDIDGADKAEVLGRDMKRIKRKEVPALRREMGIVFQDFQLLHDRSVYANLLFVLKATGWKSKANIDARINESLESVGMAGAGPRMPHELSGGEQQRVAIARALLNEPKMIIADEPTGNLDPETATHIIALLRDISKRGTAVIVSTHNLHLVEKYPGIVYRCHEGRLEMVSHQDKHLRKQEAATAPSSPSPNMVAEPIAQEKGADVPAAGLAETTTEPVPNTHDPQKGKEEKA